MKRIVLIVALVTFYLNGRADWNFDSSNNVIVTPTGLSYYDKELTTNKNGYTYVLLACPSPECGIAYRLQIMDKDGNKKLGRGGKVISSEKNRTWTTWNQYLQKDNYGNVFVAIQDARYDAGNVNYTILKFSEDGESLWKGTALNDGIGHPIEAGLSMLDTPDNGLLCAYSFTDIEAAKDCLHLEKLNKDGSIAWKKEIFQTTSSANPFPFVEKTNGDRALVLWVDKGNINANIIDCNTGDLLYDEPKVVYANGFASPKVMEVVEVMSGPDNGAIISVVDGNQQGRLVYVKNDLSIGLDGDMKGILLEQSDDTALSSTSPAVAYNAFDNTFSCFYKSFDKNNKYSQTIYYQKLDMNGEIKWKGGKTLIPLQTDDQYSFFKIRNIGDGASALFYLKYNNATNTVKGLSATVDNDGNMSEPNVFAATDKIKTGLWVSESLGDNKFITAWDEKLSDGYTLFMQEVDFASTSGMEVSTACAKPVYSDAYYSIDGTKRNGIEKGINILRRADGSIVKIAK